MFGDGVVNVVAAVVGNKCKTGDWVELVKEFCGIKFAGFLVHFEYIYLWVDVRLSLKYGIVLILT